MTSISQAKALLNQHRQMFPALGNKAYFNYGGQGPMPQGALDAITDAQTRTQDLGPFSTEVGLWIDQEIQVTREAIASELHVSPQTITLTENVTVGCNIALWGLDWHPGDHILLSDCEHPGVIATTQEIARRFAVEVTTCPLMATLNQGDPVAAIARHLRPHTRLVVLSHVLWNTGQVLPLDKIIAVCKQNNSLLLVDAAQSVGALPLNLTELGVDFYAFTGHKWLCGPAGVGGLYVHPEANASLHPTFIGLRGVIVNSEAQPVNWRPGGQRYEVATSAFPLYAGLRTAIAVHHQWGTPQQRYEQILHNSEYLWRQLATLANIKSLCTSPPTSGIVSFQIPNQPQAHTKLVQFLESQRFLTRTIANPSCVRVTVHYLTLESEIEQLIAVMQEFFQ
ncbi:aminotransferase class V-fold PLP-dependent enzyme [Fortiea contorta]|uniref:aminotransferase class V-fold PLP-dependent enzyme n=1 Tax=Fortiea contorta TaxID=1892405 RepID=UPI0003489B8D|nr:aminotransferase class V-fold PLP-dependent enzyme [Fortiea contorta]